LFDWLRRALGPIEGEIKPKAVRNINDVIISVSEGLSNTRIIQVSAWTPDVALELYKRVRNEVHPQEEGERDAAVS